MATKNNQKIRDMVELLALTGKEMLPLAREGKNYKVTTKTLSEYIGSTGGGSLPTDAAAQIEQNTENIEIIQNNITSLSKRVVAINSRVTDLEDSDFVDIDSLRSTLEGYYTKEQVDDLLGEAGGVDLTGYVNEIAASGTGNGIASVSKDGSKLTFNKATFLTDASVPAARTTFYGGIKIGYKDNGKNYGVLLDDSGKAYVNVPWESYDLSKYLKKEGGQVNYLQVSPANTTDGEVINIGVTTNEISGAHGNGTVDWKINSAGAWIGANQLATQSWADGKFQTQITGTNKLSYSLISGTPTLATVATSGNYNDLSNKPTIPDVSGYVKDGGSINSLGITSINTTTIRTQGDYIRQSGSSEVWKLSTYGSGNNPIFSKPLYVQDGTSYNLLATQSWANSNFHPLTTVDTSPTSSSTNLITSGGVFKMVADLDTTISSNFLLKTTAASTYLPLSGGTLSRDDRNVLTVNSNQGYGPIVGLSVKNVLVGNIGIIPNKEHGGHANYGLFLSNFDGNISLMLGNDGNAYISKDLQNLTKDYTLIHSGNISDYTLAKDSNGTVSLYGDIEVLSADNSVTIKNGSIISNTGGTDFWSIDDSGNGVLSRLTVEGGRDAKIILNNTDTESKYQYISFRQNGTEYGALGTFYDDNLIWNQNYILHSKNYSNYALPLSGGELVKKSSNPLTINRTGTGAPGIEFKKGDTPLGSLGVGEDFAPYFYSRRSSSLYTIIHTGNIGSYAVTSSNLESTLSDYPLSNGTRATGTWGIDISGSASYATSAGNADTLDGYHAGSFVKDMGSSLLSTHINCLGYGFDNKGWKSNGPAFTFGTSTGYESFYARIQKKHNSNTLFLGGYSSELGELGWREFAFTDSNVASASILATTYSENINYAAYTTELKLIKYNEDWEANGFPTKWTSGLSVMAGYSGWQLVTYGGGEDTPYFRKVSDMGVWSNWRALAFTDSTVAAANKLSTKRTIWGQSFDGSGNVNGAIALLDNNSTLRNVVEYRAGNLHFGYDTASASVAQDTYINGKTVYLRYSGYATGLILNSSGNVTIGSADYASNAYKLYVSGALYATDTASLTNINIHNISDANYVASIRMATDGVYLQPRKEGVGYLNTILNNRGGYVGIGTTDPQYKLDVNGDGRFNNYLAVGAALSPATSGRAEIDLVSADAVPCDLYLGADNSRYWSITTRSDSNSDIGGKGKGLGFYDAVNYTYRMCITQSGDVGIGTANPNTKLHVVGGAKVEGALSSYGITATTTAATDAAFTHYVGSTKLWWVSSYNNCANFHTALYVQSGSSPIKVATVNDLSSYLLKAGDTISGSLTFSSTSGSHIIGNSNSEIIFQPSSDTSGANIPLKIAKTGSSTYTMYCDESEVYDLGTSSYKWNILYCRSASQSSDATLKNILGNVALTTSQIANAPAVNFTWKNGGAKDVGTIAQYWKDVLPEVVSGEEGSYGMNYAVLGVVSSIILARNIETHEQRIARLEKEISDLQKELNALVNNE